MSSLLKGSHPPTLVNRRAPLIILSPGGRIGNGGIGTVTRLIATSLEESKGHYEPFVVDTGGAGSVLHAPFRFVSAIFTILRLRLIRRASLVHIQVSERGSFLRKGLLLLLARSVGMKTVLHHHGAELVPFFTNANAVTRSWVSFISRLATLNLVLGQRSRDFVVDRIGVDPSKIVVLYNAVRNPSPQKEIAAHWHSPPLLLMMAHLIPRKGVSEFLQALARLRKRGINFKAVLAGGGEVLRYQREAKALQLSDLCSFTGWLSAGEAQELLASANVVALPSFEEGLPMVILESLSLGKPVITTPVGSIPEVLEDERTCLFVEPGNVDQLTEAIARIIEDQALRATLSDAGRKVFLEQFELNNYMKTLTGLYSRLESKPSNETRADRGTMCQRS
ncbi:glycosyltransferase family 4 protein [Bradyrhizobium liaoningense]|uniref:glycosyltransferase family 4 protein n=1 Tax=Bradyrhizobium liaoningense TaxID=43992 RepID=UPI001BA5CC71|nr:glycosyltransferase family 4 protein [Bradyrhizobium liaoningense]MBR0737661.1 glycosyltransferase family 4 protein [Bradyrhizobium liaoningense]